MSKSETVVGQLRRTTKGRLIYDCHWNPKDLPSFEYQPNTVIPVHHKGKSKKQISDTEHQDRYGSSKRSVERPELPKIVTNHSQNQIKFDAKSSMEERSVSRGTDEVKKISDIVNHDLTPEILLPTTKSSDTEHQDRYGSSKRSVERPEPQKIVTNHSQKQIKFDTKSSKEERSISRGTGEVKKKKSVPPKPQSIHYRPPETLKTIKAESIESCGNLHYSPCPEDKDLDNSDIPNNEVAGLLDIYNTQARNSAKIEGLRRKEMFKHGFKQIMEEFMQTIVIVNEESDRRYKDDLTYVEDSLSHLNEEIQVNEETLKKVHSFRTDLVCKTIEKCNAVKREIADEYRKEEESKQHKLQMMKTLDDLSQLARSLCSNILNIIKGCTHKEYLPKDVCQITSYASAEFTHLFNIAVRALNEQEGLEEAFRAVAPSVKNLEEMHEKAKEVVAQAEKRAEQEAQMLASQKASIITPPIAPSIATPSQPIASTTQAMPNISKSTPTSSNSQPIVPSQLQPTANVSVTNNGSSSLSSLKLSLFVPPMAFTEYERLIKLQETVSNSFCNLSSSKATEDKKRFRFELSKAINTPINAISDKSAKHLMDKINKLSSVLNGQTVEISGKQITTKMDPEGMSFCKDYLAKKMVNQGAVASYKSAFPFAAVALCIWSQFPEVGELILAQFYLKCPYLVPYYIPQKDGQTTADYCKLLGYDVSAADIESEDSYLKKLSGVVRLYAAIVQSPLPPKFASAAHPHGIHNGWTWFARIVNLEPRPTITATIIYDFLEVAGHALMKQYGKQFQKLLKDLCHHFIPKINLVTPVGQKGPVMRLTSFLEKCIKAGKIPEPEGYLPIRWWSRRVSI